MTVIRLELPEDAVRRIMEDPERFMEYMRENGFPITGVNEPGLTMVNLDGKAGVNSHD